MIHYKYDMPRGEFDVMITEAYDANFFLPTNEKQMAVVKESRQRMASREKRPATPHDKHDDSEYPVP